MQSERIHDRPITKKWFARDFRGMNTWSSLYLQPPALREQYRIRSQCRLPLTAHDSGSGWFAIPFLQDSFIPYSMPVYPGALGVHRRPEVLSVGYGGFGTVARYPGSLRIDE